VTRATNTRSELGISAVGSTWREARQNELLAMEHLPEALRFVVAENNTCLGVTSVLRFYLNVLGQVGDPMAAEAITARKVRTLEAGEIEVFAGRYKALYGVRHLPEGISIMRYGSGGTRGRRGGRR